MTTTSDHQTDHTRTLDEALDELHSMFAPRDYISAGQLIEALSELDPDTPLLTVITDGSVVSFPHLSRLWLNRLTGEAALQFGGTEYDYSGPLSEVSVQDDLYTPVGTKDLLIEAGLWLDPEERIRAAANELLGREEAVEVQA